MQLHSHEGGNGRSQESPLPVVGMVLGAFFPDDIRVRKQAETLLQAGYRVHLLCYRRWGEPRFEMVDGIQVQRVFIGQCKTAIGFWDALNGLLFHHPAMSRALNGFIDRYGIRILHVHDLPLAGTALRFRRPKRIRVVLDFHENWTEGIKIWYSWRKSVLIRFKNRIVFNPHRWEEYEHKVTTRASHVIAVVDEMKHRLVNDHDLPPVRITVVSNTERKAFARKNAQNPYPPVLQNRFIVLYTGNIGPHRGVDTLIDALQALAPELPDLHLVIVGSGSEDAMNRLSEQVQTAGLGERVHFEGYQPFDRFYDYMACASVTAIPHHRNGHTDHTIPHKLFQGMMAGRPVLVSDCKPLGRIVSQYQCGEIFRAGDAQDCAAAIRRLYENESLRDQMAQNGSYVTLQGDLNWEAEGRKLIELYRLLGG